MISLSSIKKKSKIVYRQSKPYQALGLIYDRIMQHVEYDGWARYIKRIIETYGQFSNKILDVGCGTGQIISEMQKLRIYADGCDPSATMLKIARDKNPDKSFWIDRLPQLSKVPKSKYQVIICLYDTINYLPSLTVIGEALNRIYSLLPAGGLFIFDMVSALFCQNYFHQTNDSEIIDEKYSYQRSTFFNVETKQQINDFYIYTPSAVFEERHIQTIFSFKKIKSLIEKETYFKLIAIYDDFTFCEAAEDSDRAHFILKRT